MLSASSQGIKTFVLAYVIAANVPNDEVDTKNNRKNFLLRGEIKNCNALNGGRNFYN